MNVLSLFDGISCGQVALQRAGIKVDNYYASEIDKYAMQVTMKNYPNTIQLGDVTKWREWNIDWKSIGLLLGGTPCQGFSFAGRQLNFDDPRSKLVFVYFDILNHIKTVNPNVLFLLENVKMKKEYKDIISGYLEIEPIEINSSLVSAQNRVRLYWTNIENITNPKDKYIYLKNIIDMENRSYRALVMNNIQKSTIRKAKTYYQFDMSGKGYNSQQDRCYSINGKVNTLSASRAITKVNIMFDDLFIRAMTPEEVEQCQTLPIGYTKCDRISDNKRDDLIGNGWTVDVIAHILKCI